MVGIDGSPASHVALEWACAEAAGRALPVHLVTAYPGLVPAYLGAYAPVVSDVGWVERSDAEALIADELAWSRSRWPDVPVTGSAVSGDPARVLRALAWRAESLVIGTSHVHPAGVSMLSALAGTLVGRAAAPVVVVAESLPPRASGPVVVALDVEARADAVFSFAFRHACEHGAEVRAVAGWPGRPTEGAPALTDGRRGAGRRVAGDRHIAEVWLFDEPAAWRRRYPDVPASGIVADHNPALAVLTELARARLLVLARNRRRSVHATWKAAQRSVLPYGGRPVVVVPGR